MTVGAPTGQDPGFDPLPVMPPGERPLAGMLVLDFSQFLSGPMAAMRLADLGARVIKVERPNGGDIGRGLSFGGLELDGDTVEFHSINRNKESFTADLKDPAALDEVRRLVAQADVMIQNFRPGVMERIGLGYDAVAKLNPRLVYAAVSGYGERGPWVRRPGQDLLAQSVSGLPYLQGDRDSPPTPVGIAIADLLSSCHLASGVLAALLRRERTGRGALVQVSLLESMLDLQFEVLTAYFVDHAQVPQRGPRHSAHAYLSAPYGTYPTADGVLAIAMNDVPTLGELLGLPELAAYPDAPSWFEHQDAITAAIAARLRGEPSAHWLSILEPADVWCAPVLTLPELVGSDGFRAVEMMHTVHRAPAAGEQPVELTTTRSPLRLDGQVLSSPRAAPRLGADTAAIRAEFLEEA